VQELRGRNVRLLETVQATEKSLDDKTLELEGMKEQMRKIGDVVKRKLNVEDMADIESAIDRLLEEARKMAQESAAARDAAATSAAQAAQAAVAKAEEAKKEEEHNERALAAEQETERLRSEVAHYQDLLAKTVYN